jgi:uncharacterized protein
MMVHGDWLLTSARVAIYQPTQTAVLTDLHLGYAEARQRGGEAVPFRGLDAILAPLHTLLTQQHVTQMVIAGDLFEAGHNGMLATGLLAWLWERSVTLLAVVPGNHDRGLAAAEALPVASDGYTLGSWRIVHGDGPLPQGPVVQGHEHPCLRWSGVSAPCYLLAPDRLILPAFSLDASGVNVVVDPRWRSFVCAVIVGDKVLDFGLLGALPAALKAGRKWKKEGSVM